MALTTWRKEILAVTEKPLVMSIGDLDQPFLEAGPGDGTSFVAWTDTLVLFPLCYDGMKSVGYAPRSPSDATEALQPQGGG